MRYTNTSGREATVYSSSTSACGALDMMCGGSLHGRQTRALLLCKHAQRARGIDSATRMRASRAGVHSYLPASVRTILRRRLVRCAWCGARCSHNEAPRTCGIRVGVWAVCAYIPLLHHHDLLQRDWPHPGRAAHFWYACCGSTRRRGTASARHAISIVLEVYKRTPVPHTQSLIECYLLV